MYQSSREYLLTANTYFVRVLYNLHYQGKGNLSAENNSNCQETHLPLKMQNGSFNMLLYLVHLCSSFWLCVNPGVLEFTITNIQYRKDI